MTPTAIAFLGIGRMSEPMAKNLLKAGLSVTVWNCACAKAERLVRHGAGQLAKLANQMIVGSTIGAGDFRLPITWLVRDLHAALCEHGAAGLDHSGLFLEIGRNSGKNIA